LIISVIAIVSVFIIYTSYDYYAKPVLISKQQAFDIASKEFQCTQGQYRLNSTTIEEQLFHIKDNTVFFMDDKNMQDLSVTSNFLSGEIKSSEYVWEITWNCYDATNGQYPPHYDDREQHVKFVDAKSGVLLK
jgi:hypothetical protein